MSDHVVLNLPQRTFAARKNPNEFRLTENVKTVDATPVIVNFRRFSKLNSLEEIVPGIKNKDLVHAVAALYDQALPDVTEDIIYSTIFEKWARTILVIQNTDEALEHFKQRTIHCHAEADEISTDKAEIANQTGSCSASGDSPVCSNDAKNEPQIENGANPSSSAYSDGTLNCSRFSEVFSDMDTSDEEEEDEEEDFTGGVDEFLHNLKKRRCMKKEWLDTISKNDCLGEPSDLIGIEHRLMGCVTFDRIYPKPGHKVIHLTLLAVRKRFRGMFVGQFLTELVRDPLICGSYDAIVVNADHKATEFFEKQGFNGDVILNSKYEDIGDTWYNCKRMCFLPPYQSLTDPDVSTNSLKIGFGTDYFSELTALDLKQMELDCRLYQEKSLQAFQCQTLIMERLRKEVILLRAKVSNQQDLIEALKNENYLVREQKYNCEKEFLRLKLKFLTNIAGDLSLSDEGDHLDKTDEPVCEEVESPVKCLEA